MASWITHLMIADSVMKQYPELDRHGFSVGNIAPAVMLRMKTGHLTHHHVRLLIG